MSAGFGVVLNGVTVAGQFWQDSWWCAALLHGNAYLVNTAKGSV
jgi:hypothetical protein